MEFIFSNHFDDYSDDKRKVFFQLGGLENAVPIINALDFVDEFEIIDEGIGLSIAIQQIPEVVSALAKRNIAIYSIKTVE